jgi:hypothetical protein
MKFHGISWNFTLNATLNDSTTVTYTFRHEKASHPNFFPGPEILAPRDFAAEDGPSVPPSTSAIGLGFPVDSNGSHSSRGFYSLRRPIFL